MASPSFLGVRPVPDVSLETLLEYMDWTPFFFSWELRCPFPEVLTHPDFGETARELYANAQRMLKEIIADKLLVANGVYGIFPANADGDDILLYEDETRTTVKERLCMLRQQRVTRGDKQQNMCLSDYVALVDTAL